MRDRLELCALKGLESQKRWHKILLMVQKSQTTTWDVYVHFVKNGRFQLPTSTGEFTGFLNHQRLMWSTVSSLRWTSSLTGKVTFVDLVSSLACGDLNCRCLLETQLMFYWRNLSQVTSNHWVRWHASIITTFTLPWKPTCPQSIDGWFRWNVLWIFSLLRGHVHFLLGGNFIYRLNCAKIRVHTNFMEFTVESRGW